MDEGIRRVLHPPALVLLFRDDLNGLAYCAVAVSPGRGDIHPVVVARGGLGELWQRLEVLVGRGAHASTPSNCQLSHSSHSDSV